jgi:hypothetical protein
MSRLITLGLSGPCKPIVITPVCLHPAAAITIGKHPHCNACGEDVSWLTFYRNRRTMQRELLQSDT